MWVMRMMSKRSANNADNANSAAAPANSANSATAPANSAGAPAPANSAGANANNSASANANNSAVGSQVQAIIPQNEDENGDQVMTAALFNANSANKRVRRSLSGQFNCVASHHGWNC
jgi:hypothetical protein